MHRKSYSFVSSSVAAIVIVIMTIVGLGGSLIFFQGNYTESSGEVLGLLVKIIAIILTLVSVVFGAIYFFIKTNFDKIEEIGQLQSNLHATVNILFEININQLPEISYTQHIPYDSYKAFKKLEKVFLFLHKEIVDEKTKKMLPNNHHNKSFVSGIVCFCEGRWFDAIKLFKDVEDNVEDYEIKAQTLWRLGIAYRQCSQFCNSWRTFENLKKLTEGRAEIRSLAIMGQIITKYAEFRKKNDYKIIWQRANQEQYRDQNILEDIDKMCNDLWKEGFRSPQLLTFYWGLIKKDKSDELIIDVDKGKINILDYTINESLIGDKLYPYTEDNAIKADFYFSLAICCEILSKDGKNKQETDFIEKRDKFAKIAYKYAEWIEKDYHGYDKIYSEQYLKEVPSGAFKNEIPKGWLLDDKKK